MITEIEGLELFEKKFPKGIRLCWEEIERDLWEMYTSIISSGFDPDVIIGVARGGLVPARLLLDYFHKKYICTVQMGHWEKGSDFSEQPVMVYPLPEVDLTRQQVLVVDDICDEGHTMGLVMEYLEDKVKELRSSVLICKSESSFIPDYCARRLEEWCWVFLPWSQHEDLISFVERILQVTGGAKVEDIIRILEHSMHIEIGLPEVERVLFDMKHAGEVSEGSDRIWTLI